MHTIGIIGGIGPEATIEYYQQLIQQYRAQLNTSHYPEFLVLSIDMTQMLGYALNNRLTELVAFLQKKVAVLEAAGASHVAMASNTPHLVFDALASKVNVPMISIVEATCQAISRAGVSKVALLGTKPTMSQGFYQAVGQRHGIELVVPGEAEQAYIHDKYMGELVVKNINPATRQRLIDIVLGLKAQAGIQGVVLGGTELPLILSQAHFAHLPVFDTTQIHVQAILNQLVG